MSDRPTISSPKKAAKKDAGAPVIKFEPSKQSKKPAPTKKSLSFGPKDG